MARYPDFCDLSRVSAKSVFRDSGMKAYEIGAQNGLESLILADRPDPLPSAGEVIVRVSAASLNYRDLMLMSGGYGPRRPENHIPLSDGSGTVIALGAGVSEVALGDHVVAPNFAGWIDGPFSPSVFAADLGVSRNGWLAEQIAVPANALVKLPVGVSDDHAATLPVAGITAWRALVEVGKIKAGDLVLTLGTGGVSIFALQIAKHFGARVAITSSSDAKLAKAQALGADLLINYRTTPDWAAALMEATDGAGADIIVETGGQATLNQSIAAAAPNGRIALIGALAGLPNEGITNFQAIIGKNLTVKGITSGSREMLVNLVSAVELGGLESVIDKVFAFDDAPAAFAYLKTGAHLGKVMIRM
jgi:NADPH:quinone reductase-like Zn-dependent oxidoreductase